MPRALIVKLGAIGDALMLLPAVHELHQAGWAVDWLSGSGIEPLLRLYPWVRPIPVDDRALLLGNAGVRAAAIAGLWRRLAGRRYDLVATLAYDRRYRLLTTPVRARGRISLSQTDRATRLLPGRHHTDEYARILLPAAGIGCEDGPRPLPLAPVRPPGLPFSPLARTHRPQVVLAPGGARNLLADDALRRWPLESYVTLAADLSASGIEIVLIGGAEDRTLSPAFAGVELIDRMGALGLPETLALLDGSDVLVTHDTGPLHMAGVTRAGIVGLFGPTDPRGRLPQRPGTLALWGGEGFACRPCYDGRRYAPCPSNDCIRQLTPQAVADEVRAMLADRARGHLAPPRIVVPASTIAPAMLETR